MQDKVMLAKQRNMFNTEQLANLVKIENDGLDAALDIATKYVIRAQGKTKGVMKLQNILALNNGFKREELYNMDNIIQSIPNTTKSYFHMHRFIKLFDDDFKLFEKIQEAWKKLSVQ